MQLEIKYGLYIGLLMFLWTVVEYLVGLHSTYIRYYQIITLLAFLIPIVGIPLGMLAKRRLVIDYKFPDRFRSGIVITVVFMLVCTMGVIAYFYLVNPDWNAKMAQQSAQNYKEMGFEQPGHAAAYAKEYFNEGTFMKQSLIGNLIVGTVVTMIASSVIKRKI